MKKLLLKYSKRPNGFFGLIFVNFLFGYAPFALFFGILSLFGVVPVNFNDSEVYGLKGLLVMILFIPFIVLMFTFFMWLFFMIGNLFLRLTNKIFYNV